MVNVTVRRMQLWALCTLARQEAGGPPRGENLCRVGLWDGVAASQRVTWATASATQGQRRPCSPSPSPTPQQQQNQI